MSRIRGRNTRLEVEIRLALWRAGYRYRLDPKAAPGRPDFVMPGRRVAGFAHGCFFHGHDCHLYRPPGGPRADWWAAKIERNRQRDREVAAALREAGWRHFVVWQCAIRGKTRIGLENVVKSFKTWITSDAHTLEVRGADDGSSFLA